MSCNTTITVVFLFHLSGVSCFVSQFSTQICFRLWLVFCWQSHSKKQQRLLHPKNQEPTLSSSNESTQTFLCCSIPDYYEKFYPEYEADFEADGMPMAGAGAGPIPAPAPPPPGARPGAPGERGQGADGGLTANQGPPTVQAVTRVRQEFPEAWIWSDTRTEYKCVGYSAYLPTTPYQGIGGRNQFRSSVASGILSTLSSCDSCVDFNVKQLCDHKE